MQERIKDWGLRLVDRLGFHVAKRTRHEDIGELIRLLHPLASGVELIRLGPDGDGGYLIPNDLEGIRYAFSPGVSTRSGFEADLADRGIEVFLADFSVDRPAQLHPKFVFEKKYVGCLSNEQFMTLDEWKRLYIPDYRGDLLLQMDIEGAEFETLFSASAALLAQYRIIVVEFHDLHELLNRRYFKLAARLFQKLLLAHSVVHIHPNNYGGSVKSGGFEIPRTAEFTFFRNDRFQQREYCRTFPHPLDKNNHARKPTLALPECWYR